MNLNRITLAMVCVLVSGCIGEDDSEDPDIRSIELGIATGTTLGQSAAIALDAIAAEESGGEVTCARVISACADYPCDGEVEITYGGGCPLPLGGEAIGSTIVTGNWTSAEEASFDFTLTDVMVDDRYAVVASATTVRASRSDGVTTLEYTGANASVHGVVALAAASTWDVTIDDAGTPGDSSDDVYTVNSTSAAAGTGSGASIQVEDVVVTPDCQLNPTSGSASITVAGLTGIRIDDLIFSATCDGTAELDSTLGNNRTVTLNFLE